MTIQIVLNESNASRRCVPIQLLRVSDGTSAATNESGRTFYFSLGGVDYGSGGSLSAISAAMGMYHCCFSASKVSRIGAGAVYYGLPNSSGTALAMSVPFEIVPPGPYNEKSVGDSQLQAGSTTEVQLASGETTTDDHYIGWNIDIQYPSGFWASNVISDFTGSNLSAKLRDTLGTAAASAMTYRLRPAARDTDFSTVTVQGVSNYANISNVTLHAGTHSDVTIQGVTRVNSGVTLNANTHSGATIQGLSNYANISNVTLAAGTHSNVTIQGLSNYANISNVTLTSVGERSIASSILSTDMGNSRLVQQALFALRNKVSIDGSRLTVFKTDDTTSDWTGTVSNGTLTITAIDPGGA